MFRRRTGTAQKTKQPGNAEQETRGGRRTQDRLTRPPGERCIGMNSVKFRYAAASEKGSRESNQDNLRAGREHPYFEMDAPVWVEGSGDAQSLTVFTVCDGIGGEALGDIAAMSALDELQKALPQTLSGEKSLADTVLIAVERAQSRVLDLYRSIRKMGGCTLSLVALYRDRYLAVNIGDSPIFLAREHGGELRELSCRHTLETKKLEMGIPAEPGDECCLLRYLGKPGRSAAQMAHVEEGTIGPRDSLLLCTDGVTGTLSAAELRSAMEEPSSLRALVRHAAGQKNADNCTAICVAAE